jgi:transcriptional regulator with XRE-family HTH domain
MGQHEKSRASESNLAYEFARISQDVATAVAGRMDDLHMSQTDLAKSIGASTARVLKILSGDELLTLRSLAMLATAVGGHFEITFVQDQLPRGNGSCPPVEHASTSRTPSVVRLYSPGPVSLTPCVADVKLARLPYDHDVGGMPAICLNQHVG